MLAKEADRTRILMLLAKALVFVASLQMLGLYVYWNNQELQLPLVQHANDPSLFPGDPYIGTLPYYVSVLWQVLWLPFRLIAEKPLLILLTLGGRWLILEAAGRLGRSLSGGSRLAEIACWLVFACGVSPLVGAGTIVANYFEHTSLAVAAYLMCLCATVDRKPVRAGVWLGVCALCNVMHAAHGAGLLLIALAAVPELRAVPTVAGRSPGKQWLLGGLATLVVGSPAIVMALLALRVPRIDSAAFLDLLRFYYPAHFFPSSWPVRDLRLLAVALSGTLTLTALPILAKPPRKLVAGLTGAYLLYLALSLGVERLGAASLVNLQFARASDLWCAVAAVFTTAGAVRLIRDHAASPMLSLAGTGLAFGSVALWAFRGVLPYPPEMMLTALCALAIGIVVAFRPQSKLAVTSAVLTAFAAWPYVWTMHEAARPSTDEYPKFTQVPWSEWRCAQWAKASTPVDAAFLVDPQWGAWRMLSRRSSFVTWKDGAGLMWDPPYALQWAARVRDLGVDARDPANRYPACLSVLSGAFASLDDRRAADLAARYRLAYWVVPARMTTRFAIAWANKDTKVVILR